MRLELEDPPVKILLARAVALRNKLQTFTVALAVAAAVAVFVVALPWHIGRATSIPVLLAGAIVYGVVGRVCNAIASTREVAWINELGEGRPQVVDELDQAIVELRVRRRFL